VSESVDRSIEKEFNFRISRSGGKGGQHVNKVETKVQLQFHVESSQFLTEEQKQKILEKLHNRIDKDGNLLIVSEKFRTQLANKKAVVERFYQLLSEAFHVEKKRIKVRPSRAMKRQRLKEKKQLSEKKSRRRPPPKDLD